MDKVEIKKFARLHTDVIRQIVLNYSSIIKTLKTDSKGVIRVSDGSELLAALANIESVDNQTRETAARAAKLLPLMIATMPKLSPDDRNRIGKFEDGLAECKSTSDIMTLLETTAKSAENTWEKEVIAYCVAMVEDGSGSIYDANGMNETIKQSNAMDAAIDCFISDSAGRLVGMVGADVGGAYWGGAMGGITGGIGGGLATEGPGAGPGALIGGFGGSVAGAYGASGKFAVGAIWKGLGGGAIHGPGDPNGPIGPHRPPSKD